MPARFAWTLSAALLALSFPAHAQAIHPLWIVGALSPLAVLLLTVLLGWLARSLRLGLVHAVLVPRPTIHQEVRRQEIHYR